MTDDLLNKIRKRLGKVHMYFGDGKGKTSAALGVALRALGYGLNVYVVQFLKGRKHIGEFRFFQDYHGKGKFGLKQFGDPNFINLYSPDSKAKEHARKGLEYAKQLVLSGEWDVIILDEILYAVEFGVIRTAELIEFLEEVKGKKVEILLTGGREVSETLFKFADYISKIEMLKHPFMEGILARPGVDY